jgi:hypothetical protein
MYLGACRGVSDLIVEESVTIAQGLGRMGGRRIAGLPPHASTGPPPRAAVDGCIVGSWNRSGDRGYGFSARRITLAASSSHTSA